MQVRAFERYIPLTHSIPWEDFKSYLPFVLVYKKKIFWFQHKERKECLAKIPTQTMFKLLPIIFFKICSLRHPIFSRKNKRNALLYSRFWFCCPGFKLLETPNSVITCILTLPGGDLPNGTTLSNFIK